MISTYHQPEGDPFQHEITAELAQDEGIGLTFVVSSDGEAIGEVDVDILPEGRGFISGVGPGEKINNGYLKPASFVIASCLRDRDPKFSGLYDINDELISPLQ
jgi:hypothetical protein